MMSLEAMEQPRVAFLYELYKRSEGNSRHGVPYEDLVDALGFDERVTRRIQRDLDQEGLVELTAVPWITNVGRLVIGSAHRRGSRQTIGITYQGVQLMEDILSMFSSTEPPTHSAS
jgi:hypothetical protein